MKNEHWMLRFKMTENSGVSRCYLTRIWLVAEKKNRKKTETTDCNMACVPHVSYFVLLIIYNNPHLVHSGESCPGKISRLMFGVLTFLRLKSWCLTLLAGIYSLRRIKLAGANFLMPKVSRKAFLPL